MKKLGLIGLALSLFALAGCDPYSELTSNCTGQWRTPPGNNVILDDQRIIEAIQPKGPTISTMEKPCYDI